MLQLNSTWLSGNWDTRLQYTLVYSGEERNREFAVHIFNFEGTSETRRALQTTALPPMSYVATRISRRLSTSFICEEMKAPGVLMNVYWTA